MFKNLLKAGVKNLQNKAGEVKDIREQLEGMIDSSLIAMFKKNDFSSENLAIGAELRDRGYSLVNGRWVR